MTGAHADVQLMLANDQWQAQISQMSMLGARVTGSNNKSNKNPQLDFLKRNGTMGLKFGKQTLLK